MLFEYYLYKSLQKKSRTFRIFVFHTNVFIIRISTKNWIDFSCPREEIGYPFTRDFTFHPGLNPLPGPTLANPENKTKIPTYKASSISTPRNNYIICWYIRCGEPSMLELGLTGMHMTTTQLILGSLQSPQWQQQPPILKVPCPSSLDYRACHRLQVKLKVNFGQTFYTELLCMLQRIIIPYLTK